jgi:O-antigen ligase
MRERVAPFYWAAAGALAGFGLIGLMTIGGPFLLAGAVLALAGLILLRTKGIWALFVGFGGLPALVFLLHISNGVRTALNPFCAEMREPGALAAGAADPGPVSLSCSFVPASY